MKKKTHQKHAVRIANALISSKLAIRSPSYDLQGPKKIPWGYFGGTTVVPIHGRVGFSIAYHSLYYSRALWVNLGFGKPLSPKGGPSQKREGDLLQRTGGVSQIVYDG